MSSSDPDVRSETGTPASSTATSAERFPWVGMLALAAAAFLAVTSETLPTGLLPEVASGLSVSTPQAGLLVSVYAFTVVIATTPLTALTRRIPRRPLVVVVIVVIGLSSLLLAVSPNYGVAVVARITGGMAHGVFWAVTGAYAGHIVPPHQLARAVAITSGGVSLALILGSPLATILGHAFGWRTAFAVVGCLLVVGAAVVGTMLPKVQRTSAHLDTMTGGVASITGGVPTITAGGTVVPARRKRTRRRDASIRPVLMICVLTMLITLGSFTLNAYVAPFVSDAMGFGTAAVGPMLFAGGLMGAVATVLVGTVLGRIPRAAAATGLLLTTIAIAILGAFAGVPPVAIGAFALWALSFGCLPPLLQTELLHAASARFRDTASALYTTAFNVGIGGGAVVGGAIYAVWSIDAVPWAALAILVVAIVLFPFSIRRRVIPQA
ncbi:MFS transporter [Planctomonas sp. JC2975]|uniref:MFS transporter n=1 Tax=Planctomonas sp. JC2975 TaxID=2729626 RepID=UPI0014735728|nr:MFS transporter [Planctomonas sp. JC2975]NNC11723.1 MFS transporter [Planctomonas sp. JC2975]